MMKKTDSIEKTYGNMLPASFRMKYSIAGL